MVMMGGTIAKATRGAARGAIMAMGGGANAGKGSYNGSAMAMMGGSIAKATRGAARGAAMAMGGGANAGMGSVDGAAMAIMGGSSAEVGTVVVAVKAAGENDAKEASMVLEEGKMTGEVVRGTLGSGGSCFGAEGVKILAGGGATGLVVEAELEGSAEGAIITTTVEDESG